MNSSNLNGATIQKGQAYRVELTGYFRPDWSYDVGIVDTNGGARWSRTIEAIQLGSENETLAAVFLVEDADPSITSGNLTITVIPVGQGCYIPALTDQMVEY